MRKNRSTLLFCIALAFGCGGGSSPAGTAEQPPAAAETPLTKCAGCHKPDALDLSVHEREALRAMLDEIRSGQKKHPTDMTALSDAELDEAAAKLGKQP